jgi:hypothetical protein
MQNILPISRNSDVRLDHAQLIYAIINWIHFCLCKHMVMTMIELHQDNTVALLFGGLISKILKAKLPSIPPTEPIEVPEGSFGKATVMKSNPQLRRFYVVDEPAPLAPPTSSSFRPSSADLLLQLNLITNMLQAQDLKLDSIDRYVEHIDQRVGIIEIDVE